jgi:hypothetical protein
MFCLVFLSPAKVCVDGLQQIIASLATLFIAYPLPVLYKNRWTKIYEVLLKDRLEWIDRKTAKFLK